eukprot:103659_1
MSGRSEPLLLSDSMTNLHDIADDDDFSDAEDIVMSDGRFSPHNRNIMVNDTKEQQHTVNLPGSAYFSFQHHVKDSSSRLAESLLSDGLTSHSDSAHSPVQLPQTDFVPRHGPLRYNAHSWFKLFRIKYFILMSSFLCFVAIVTYFITPRAIDAWIEITIQKLQFPSKGQLNIQMIVAGHLFVTNPNYLPIILDSMQMDIYFNHTKYKKNNTEHVCKQMFLFSFTNTWNELQNEQLYAMDYPFFVTINQNVSNKTLTEFNQYVMSSCKAMGSYVLRTHIYPQYEYTRSKHQIAFYTDTYANQGCPNQTSKSDAIKNVDT